MKGILVFSLLIILLVTPISEARIIYKIESNPFSMYPDYQYNDGKVQKYFDRCNPCTFSIVVDDEKELFSEVMFEFSIPSFSNSVGKSEACIPIEDKTHYLNGIGDRQEWQIATAMDSTFCQLHGYQDYAFYSNKWCKYTYECGRYSGRSCIGNEVRCFKYVSETSDWIEIKKGGILLARFENGDSVTKKQVNLAEYTNDYCYDSIMDCQKFGECDGCEVSFQAYSENRGGSFEVSDSPVKVVKMSEVPTTTTTTTPITTTTTVVSAVNSFEDCVNAGLPVMESYPRQCSTPDGRTFVETIIIPTQCEDPTWIMDEEGICKPPENGLTIEKKIIISIIILLVLFIAGMIFLKK